MATPAMAVEFAIVGSRAAGMGGAGVAVTTDAYATYWNPAGLAMTQTVDIRFQVSAQGVNRSEFLQTVQDIEDFNSSDPAQAQALVDKINSGGSASAVATGGLYFKGHFGEHAFGFNVSNVANAGSFVSQNFSQPAPNSISGQLALRGLEQRQVNFSYAYAFADKTFSIGMTGRVIQGAAYTGSATVTGGQDVTLSDNFGKAQISTAFGIDVGAIYRPSSWLRLGIVAKDLNQPEFDAPDGSKFKLNPQVRGGVALNPWSTMTVTADMDITSNQTLVPGIKSQVLSLGMEQTVLSEFLSFRVGTYKNVEDAKSVFTPTAGIGVRIYSFRLDLAGGYDFNEGGAIASGALSLTF
jgi:hypothetical protein